MNTTPFTPPPPAGSPQPAPPRSRATWITPVLGIIGGVVLVVALATATFAGIRVLNTDESTQSVDVAGVTDLDINASAAEFTIAYDDIDEAVLDVRGARGWELERNGDSLEVHPPRRWIFGWNFGSHERVTLTLPESMRSARLDADFVLSAGSLRAEGQFGAVDLEVSAGDARVEGSARQLDVEVSAGRADVALNDVSKAVLSVSAGRLDVDLGGTAPSEVEVDVSAGEMNLIVPDVSYAVSSDVSAGSFDNRVEVASSSPRTIDVDVSAGSATVRPGN